MVRSAGVWHITGKPALIHTGLGHLWFVTLHRAIQHAHTTLDAVLAKARFWQRFASTPFNPRHITLLNRLLDDFDPVRGKPRRSGRGRIARTA